MAPFFLFGLTENLTLNSEALFERKGRNEITTKLKFLLGPLYTDFNLRTYNLHIHNSKLQLKNNIIQSQTFKTQKNEREQFVILIFRVFDSYRMSHSSDVFANVVLVI